jgi:proline racemase
MTSHEFPPSMQVIDSHTEGEPTRVVVSGWPDLAGDSMEARRADLLNRFDHLRTAVICEPRGHDAIVGALLTPPVSVDATAGVIFFNNAGCLGMCGHGLIGVVQTLAYLGRIGSGRVVIDTPAGTVAAQRNEDGSITIRNVPAYAHATDVSVDVPGIGRVTGDVAYGGNWFFITHLTQPPLTLSALDELSSATLAIRASLHAAGITGRDGAEIGHIELYTPLPPRDDMSAALNYVMCPGGAYDRSPCGTGTSAKLALLHARGQLQIGEHFVQRSVTGGEFEGWLERDGAEIVPHIRGRAHITAESTLRFSPHDPLRAGFTASA